MFFFNLPLVLSLNATEWMITQTTGCHPESSRAPGQVLVVVPYGWPMGWLREQLSEPALPAGAQGQQLAGAEQAVRVPRYSVHLGPT
jgi:hypothetical protein